MLWTTDKLLQQYGVFQQELRPSRINPENVRYVSSTIKLVKTVNGHASCDIAVRVQLPEWADDLQCPNGLYNLFLPTATFVEARKGGLVSRPPKQMERISIAVHKVAKSGTQRPRHMLRTLAVCRMDTCGDIKGILPAWVQDAFLEHKQHPTPGSRDAQRAHTHTPRHRSRSPLRHRSRSPRRSQRDRGGEDRRQKEPGRLESEGIPVPEKYKGVRIPAYEVFTEHYTFERPVGGFGSMEVVDAAERLAEKLEHPLIQQALEKGDLVDPKLPSGGELLIQKGLGYREDLFNRVMVEMADNPARVAELRTLLAGEQAILGLERNLHYSAFTQHAGPLDIVKLGSAMGSFYLWKSESVQWPREYLFEKTIDWVIQTVGIWAHEHQIPAPEPMQEDEQQGDEQELMDLAGPASLQQYMSMIAQRSAPAVEQRFAAMGERMARLEARLDSIERHLGHGPESLATVVSQAVAIAVREALRNVPEARVDEEEPPTGEPSSDSQQGNGE